MEDDRTRRYELDGEDEILEIADEMDDTVPFLQRGQGISELPQANGPSWEMPHQERAEVIGDEIAQELECPIQGREDSVEVQNVEGLESPIRAGGESMVSESAKEQARE